ncbi:MAG: 5-oxoprolinase [Phyllobacteriaceae bacterium]|nr:5-oxoprolinase [Phyllobacteriaceae bacterium]MBA92338.1 5-oxoprolinase [Phyllobacteriaceae bacterium]
MKTTSVRAPWRIGIDVGGTFTDLVLIDSAGEVFAYKSPSEPANPANGILRALEGAAARLDLSLAALLGDCAHFIHGTTVATNVLLERKGAKTGLITTKGFRDTLEIRRGYRELMWDHRTPWKDVLVPRSLRLPIDERMLASGEPERTPEAGDVAALAETFRNEGVEAVAVCLLHAYANGAHEQICAEILRREMPGVYVTVSSELAPIVGEFERTSTTVANAYVAPRVLPYLHELGEELKRLGLKRDLLLVQSNGGAVSLEQISKRPAALALSGPAAGLASLRHIGELTGNRNLISIEIGGTSCDVTVVNAGNVAETDAISVDETLICLPSVEIHTIGTGGGTICGVDDGGLIFVGPEGAGAKPGPACYGLGGDKPTLTDAQLALGRLREGSYAGGSLKLDKSLAESALHATFSPVLGENTGDAAAAIIRLSDLSIQHAIEKVSLVRGLDPANYVLVGAGGAGALHVADVARKMGMRRVFVPRLAGVFCAFGMCNADVRHDLVKTIGARLDGTLCESLEDELRTLEQKGAVQLAKDGFTLNDTRFTRQVEMCYAGQQWPISLAVEKPDVAELRRRFDEEHERIYASRQPDAALEVVGIRVSAVGQLPVHHLATPPVPEPIAAPVVRYRSVRLTGEAGGRENVAVLSGPDLEPGHFVVGPAIVEEATTTILIGEGDRLEVDPFGNYDIAIALSSGESRNG